MMVLFTTFSDLKTAKNAAKKLVENKICACVNIVKIESSIYRWKGKITQEPEFLAIIKLSEKNYDRAEREIKKLHPYELPEIIAFKVERGNKRYLSWVEHPH